MSLPRHAPTYLVHPAGQHCSPFFSLTTLFGSFRFVFSRCSYCYCLLPSRILLLQNEKQNGASKVETEFVDKDSPLFIRNGRDLASIAFKDLVYTEAFRAALVLVKNGVLGGSGGPYEKSERQVGFATFGEPHILTAMASGSSSTRHAWYAKVRRRSRGKGTQASPASRATAAVELCLPQTFLTDEGAPNHGNESTIATEELFPTIVSSESDVPLNTM